MAYMMTKEEKETNVLWNQTQEPVLISGYDPALLRKSRQRDGSAVLRRWNSFKTKEHPCQ